MSMLLGDGSIGVYGNRKKGSLTMDHGIAQSDYLKLKVSFLDLVFNRKHNVRQGHKGKSIQVMAYDRKLRAYNKFVKTNNRKSIPKILRWIDNPEFALAIWLMDDGYCEPSFSVNRNGEKKLYGFMFRIFTCDQTDQEMQEIKQWIDEKFNINCKIIKHFNKQRNKAYPIIKINGPDSRMIWEKLRSFILTIDSMKYKFRYAEDTFQYKKLQRTLDDKKSNDIVDA